MLALPASVGDTLALLGRGNYVADRSLATAVYLALHAEAGRCSSKARPGSARPRSPRCWPRRSGAGSSACNAMRGSTSPRRSTSGTTPRQMIEIRLAEAAPRSRDKIEEQIFSDRFLIKRPLLQALEPELGGAPVLLIDELDRTDEPFEAYLLEVLSDFQVTIPEIGTIKAEQPPIVIITSNRTREIHDALKRRCFYYWVDYPDAERELRDPEAQGARRGGAAVARGRRLRAEAAHDGSVQAARHRRDDRLDRGADAARRAGADAGGDQRHARRAAQIPGRHRPDPRQRGRAPARPGQGRSSPRREADADARPACAERASRRRASTAGCSPT